MDTFTEYNFEGNGKTQVREFTQNNGVAFA